MRKRKTVTPRNTALMRLDRDWKLDELIWFPGGTAKTGQEILSRVGKNGLQILPSRGAGPAASTVQNLGHRPLAWASVNFLSRSITGTYDIAPEADREGHGYCLL